MPCTRCLHTPLAMERRCWCICTAGSQAQNTVPSLGHRHLCPGALLLAIARTCLHRKIPFPWWDLLFSPQGSGCPGARGLSVPHLHRWCEAILLTSRIPVPGDRDGWQSRATKVGDPSRPRGGCAWVRPLRWQHLPGAGAGRVRVQLPPTLGACQGKSSLNRAELHPP